MARNKLLREAIADAKAVRETALANAKAALEEAFTPHLTSMLSQRLRREADLDELNDPVDGDGHGSDDGGETDVEAVEKSSHTGNQNVTQEAVDDAVQSDAEGLASSDIAQPETQAYGTSSPKMPSKSASATDSDADTDNEGLQQPHGTRVSEGIYEDDDEFEGDELDVDGSDDDADLAGLEGDLDADSADEMGADDMGMGDEEEETDLDLEAIIRELESDMVDGEEDDLGVTEDDMYDDDEDEPVMEQNDPAAADGHGPDEGGEKDAEANMKSTFTQGEGDKQTGPISEADGDEDELDLEEILREIEDEEEAELAANEVTQLRSELKEYRDAVKYLRSKLNEVNLLNAKLLFTNKLFKSYNMDVRQKVRVVENFDRATTVREAKLVYATLAEAFRGKPVTRKRSITEGIASRTVGSTKPRGQKKAEPSFGNTPTVLAEGVALAERFKKLAGIKSR